MFIYFERVLQQIESLAMSMASRGITKLLTVVFSEVKWAASLWSRTRLTLEVAAGLLEKPELVIETLVPAEVVADRVADNKFTTEPLGPAEAVIGGLVDTKVTTEPLGVPEAVESLLGGTGTWTRMEDKFIEV